MDLTRDSALKVCEESFIFAKNMERKFFTCELIYCLGFS